MNSAPVGLGEKALKLWEDVTALYQLRPDELRLLEDACREVDLIEAMQESLPKSRFTVRGSMGQQVAHPLIAELRQHRATLASLMKQLKLVDLAGGGAGRQAETPKGTDASSSARRAAAARWGQRG